MPCIRELVKRFSYPLAAPHVYTGVESILPLMARMSAVAAETPSKRARRTTSAPQVPLAAVPDIKLCALVVMVFLYVLSRMTDEDVTPEQYDERLNLAIGTVLQTPNIKNVAQDEMISETEELMAVAQHEGWLQMEWFLNVSPPNDVDEMQGVESTSAPAARVPQGLKPGGSDYIGLGTMLQDSTDYLGEHQRQDFKTWKARIMARYDELEAGA